MVIYKDLMWDAKFNSQKIGPEGVKHYEYNFKIWFAFLALIRLNSFFNYSDTKDSRKPIMFLKT